MELNAPESELAPPASSLSDTFTNPILAGFHPDPSICRRADGGYLLATSSFEYFPGIPLFTSDDLVSWTPIGHVFDRGEQLDLEAVEYSDGLWAPTIRQHDGIYYLVVTLCRNRHASETFLSTTQDPEGPWSQPILLDADGIDPSLFFDEDGRCWFTACRDTTVGGNPGELWSQELDLQTLRLVGPQFSLWGGALNGAWAEGPHIYKREGIYYLLAAEGGTERNHAVTLATATNVNGPYRSHPANPVLTHRHLGEEYPIQNVGHADLVETDAGQTWAVVLGVRPYEGHHVLGREVFLVPVRWETGRPIFAPGVGVARLLESRPVATAAPIDSAPEFKAAQWDPKTWSTLRYDESTSGISRDGDALVLSATSNGPDTLAPQATFVRRQQHHDFTAEVTIQFDAASGGRAGLVIMQHRLAHITLSIESLDGAKACVLRSAAHPTPLSVVMLEDAAAQFHLQVQGRAGNFVFSAGSSASGMSQLPVFVPFKSLSTESVGGFTGVVMGPFAVATAAHVFFTDFQYHQL